MSSFQVNSLLSNPHHWNSCARNSHSPTDPNRLQLQLQLQLETNGAKREPNGRERERESERLIEVLLLILQVAIGTAEANGNLGEPCQWPSSLVTDTFSLPRPLSLALSLNPSAASSSQVATSPKPPETTREGALVLWRTAKAAPTEANRLQRKRRLRSFGELRRASRSFEARRNGRR